MLCYTKSNSNPPSLHVCGANPGPLPLVEANSFAIAVCQTRVFFRSRFANEFAHSEKSFTPAQPAHQFIPTIEQSFFDAVPGLGDAPGWTRDVDGVKTLWGLQTHRD